MLHHAMAHLQYRHFPSGIHSIAYLRGAVFGWIIKFVFTTLLFIYIICYLSWIYIISVRTQCIYKPDGWSYPHSSALLTGVHSTTIRAAAKSVYKALLEAQAFHIPNHCKNRHCVNTFVNSFPNHFWRHMLTISQSIFFSQPFLRCKLLYKFLRYLLLGQKQNILHVPFIDQPFLSNAFIKQSSKYLRTASLSSQSDKCSFISSNVIIMSPIILAPGPFKDAIAAIVE